MVVLVPVQFRYRLRNVWLVLRDTGVRVTLESVKATAALPTIGSSMAYTKELLVVPPQVPVCSPVPINSMYRLVENVDIYPYPVFILVQFGVWVSSISAQFILCVSLIMTQLGV